MFIIQMKLINKIALTGLVALICSVFSLTAAAEDNNNEALAVTVVMLETVASKRQRDVEAELVSVNDAAINAEVTARVTEINVRVGDQVQTSDVLARLECRDFEVALRQATAGAATVRARIAATAARAEAAESRADAAAERAAAALARVRVAVSQVRANEFQVQAAASQVQAAQARVSGASARAKATTATMNASGTRINTVKSRANTAKAQAAAAQARIPAAQSQLSVTQAQLKRNQQLRAQQLIAANVLEQSQASVESARSSLRAAQADATAAQAAVVTANAEISTAGSDFRAAQAQMEASNADVASSQAEIVINESNVAAVRAGVETAQSNADVSAAEAAVADADVVTAQSEWAAAKADLMAAETELETALAQVEAADIVVARCEITAPFSGQITARALQLGQVAAPGALAFQILQTDEMEVSVQLSAEAIRAEAESEQTLFIVGDEALAVERRAVIARVDQATGTQEVRFKVNDLHGFPVGQSGRLRWQSKLSSLPPNWLVRRDGELGIMLAVGDKAQFEPLTNAQEGQPVRVDLPPDTRLIDANRLRARDGQKIQYEQP